MRNLVIFFSIFISLFLTKLHAQETFEFKAKMIAAKIDAITKEEKEALKVEVGLVNQQLESGSITNAEADQQKRNLTEVRAKRTAERIAVAEAELSQLVKDRVDGKIKDADSTRTYSIAFDAKNRRDRIKEFGEPRTTTQFVFAAGLNNLETNNSVAHSDYKIWGSHFYEWGFTYNTRILKANNLLHAKYGFSLMYNDLRPTDNHILIKNDDQTDLETSPINLKDSRFRSVNLVVPVHLEFDFSKKELKEERRIYRTHRGFRFGIGGFAGVNVKSKQVLKYEDTDGNEVRQKTRGDFNATDFIYGVSTYIGYKETSLYVKCDLNPLFIDNAIDQNNISMGIRFDFN